VADLPTRLDLFQIGRQHIITRAKKIDPTQVDVEGSDANIFVGSASVIGAAIIRQIAYSVARLLLDGAEEEDLDRYALDRYNEERKGASPARGSVDISRSSAAGGRGAIPAGTPLRSSTGVEYITLKTVRFGDADLVQRNVPVRAVQAGKSQQVGAGFIKEFSKPNTLFDPTLLVTNPKAMAGGEERESADEFRQRIRTFWKTQARGTLGAIERGALSVPGVTSARAESVITLIGKTAIPARVVLLYISDSSGVASDALATDVLTALEDYKAGGIAVIVYTSQPLLIDVELSLSFSANVDTLALSELVRVAVYEYINSLPVNGPLLIGELLTVLSRFRQDGLIPTLSSIVAPVGDLYPTAGQTIRTTLDRVKVD